MANPKRYGPGGIKEIIQEERERTAEILWSKARSLRSKGLKDSDTIADVLDDLGDLMISKKGEE